MTVFRHAFVLGPEPRATAEAEIAAALEDEACAWVHLQADVPAMRDWIETRLAYLPKPVRDALTEAETRPRATLHGGGVLLILRGINLNPGAEPEDMVSLRIWADPSRVVTLGLRHLRSVDEIAESLLAGEGPRGAGAFLAAIVERLTDKIGVAVARMDDAGDALEAELLEDVATDALRSEIGDLRAASVDYRRFLGPMREALTRLLQAAPPGLLEAADRVALAEAEEGLRRDVEINDSLRDRLIVLRDELQSRRDARLNRNLYVLSVVSAVFLPLGFLTGLMGINLAGMPGAAWPPAFWIFTGLLLLIGGGLVWLLWWLEFVGSGRRGSRARDP